MRATNRFSSSCCAALRRAVIACLAIGLLPTAAIAQTTYFWNGTAVWTDAEAWSATISGTDAGAVPGTGDTAFFSAETVTGADTTVDMGNSGFIEIGGLRFGGTTATGTTTLIGGGGVPMILLLNGGSSIVLDADATTGATIGSTEGTEAVDIELGASSTVWTNDSSQVLTVLNSVSNPLGAATLTITGAGETRLLGSVFDSFGVFSLSKQGSGTLRLGGVNAYTGTTTLGAGTLLLDNEQALAGSTLDLGGGTLSFGSLEAATFGGLSGTANLALANASSAAVALTVGGNNQSSTYTGNLTGPGSFTKDGTGTLALTGSVGYAGSTTVLGGTLSFAGPVEYAGDTTIQGGGLTIGPTAVLASGSYAGAIVANGTLTIASAVNHTLSGVISGNGTIVKSNTSTLLLTGANSFTGTTRVEQGLLGVAAPASLSGSVDLSAPGTLDLPANDSATARIWSNAITGSGTVRLNFSYDAAATATSLTGISGFNGTVRLLASGTTRDKFAVTSALTTGATVEVNPGTTLFNTAATTFTAIRVSGTGNAEGRGALRVASTLTAPTTLLGDSLASFEAGTLAGTVTGGTSGPITLTLGGAGASTGTISGIISNGSGVVSIVSAAGDTLLSGVNTYTGRTTINAGSRIRVNADSGLGAAPAAFVANQLVIAGGTLAVVTGNQTFSANRGITITGSATIDTSSLAASSNNSTAFSGVITGTGPLTIRANGDTSAGGGGSNTYVNLNATNVFVGDVTITSGIVGPLNNASFGSAGNRIILAGGGLVGPGGGTLIREIVLQPGTNILRLYGGQNGVMAGPLTGSGNINTTDSGAWTFTGDLSAYSGTMTVQTTSNVRLLSSGSTLGGTYATANTFSIAGFVGQTLGGNITGSGALTKFGAGTLTLTGTNSYSGGTSILGGTLSAASIADAGGVGSIGPYTSSTPGFLSVQGGAFRYTGSGTQSSNRNFWMDNAPGTIDVVNPTADITFAGAGGNITFTLTKTGSGRLTIADAVGGAAGFVVDQGRLTLTGANTYTGTTSVTGGQLVLGNQTAVSTSSPVILGSSGSISFGTLTTATFASLAGSGNLVLTNTAATPAAVRLTVGGNNLGTSYTGNFSGLGSLVKTGSGVFSLSGSNTYSGTTAVTAGVLAVSSSAALPGWSTAGRITVASGAGLALGNAFSDADYATVAASGNVASGGLLGFDTTAGDRVFEGALSGTLGLVKTGANTLFLTAPLVSTGPTRVLGGTLDLGGFAQVVTGTLTVDGGRLANGTVTSASATYDIVSGTVSASLGGAAGLTKTGTGFAWLTGVNTYTGTTTISGGVLAVSSTASLPGWNTPGRYLVSGGAGLAVGNAVTDANLSTILATGNFATNARVGFDTSVGDRTFGLGLTNTGSGALGLTKLGNNTLTLTGSSTYTGGTVIAGGTLRVTTLADSGYSSLGTSGTLTIAGGVLQFAGQSASTGRVIVFGTNVGGTIDVVPGATLTTSGNWLGGGGVTKTGEGTLTITQNYAGPRVNIGPESGGDFTMTAGVLNMNSAFTFSQGSSRAATFLQTGGIVNLSTEAYLGDGTGGGAYTSTYTLVGGTFTQAAGTFRVGTNGGSRGFLTIGGGTGAAVATMPSVQLATNASTEGTLLLGINGLLATGGISRGTGFATTIFDGGTLRLTANNTSLLTGVTTLVRSGGVTLDTGTFTVTIDQALAPDTGSTGGFTKIGNGVLRLGGVNTYTGTTAVTAGVLAISTTAALPGWDTAGRWTVTPGAALAVGNRVSDASIATILGGSNLTAGDFFGFDTTEGSRSYAPVLADLPSGALGLTKVGNNTLTLTGSNTFTGSTTIRSGTLATALPAALATTGTIVVSPGAALQLPFGGPGNFVQADWEPLLAKTSFGSTAGLLALDTTLASGTWDSLTIGGGLTQIGNNPLTLSGSTTLGGSVTPSAGGIDLAGGTLTVGSFTLSTAGTIGIQNGAFRNTAVTVNNASGTASLGSLSLVGSSSVTKTGAGTLSITSPSTATTGGLAANGGLVVVPAGSGSFGGVSIGGGGTLTVNGGSLTTGATVSVVTGTLNVNSGLLNINRIVTGDNSGAQSFVTITGGTLQIVGTNNNNDTSASFLLGHWGSSSARSTFVQSGGLVESLAAAMSLGWDTASGNTVTVSGGTMSLLGIKLANGRNNAATFTLSGGRLNLGLSGIDTNTNKTINLASGTVGALANWTATQNLNLTSTSGITFDTADTVVNTVPRTITLSGNLSGTGSIRAIGPGILVLGGSNSYAGPTVANVGTLRLSGTFALPGGTGATGGTANLALAGLLDLAATDFLRPLGTGASAFQFTGEGGFAATGAARTVNLGGAAAPVTWGAGSFLPDGAAFLLSSTTADNTLTFANPIDVGAPTRTFQVARGSGGRDAVLSGALSGAGGIVKSGSGVLALDAANTYLGTTTVNAGVLAVSSTASLPGWDTTGRWSVASGAALAVGSAVSDADVATILGTTNIAAGGAIGFDTSAADRTVATPLGDMPSGALGLVKVGSGTLTLSVSNTFTGPTRVFGGSLALADQNALQSSVLEPAGGAMVFSSAVVGNSFAVAGLAGSGSISLQNNAPSPAAVALVVGGGGASTTYAGNLGGIGGIVKTGTGTLTLTGINTFTGTSTVSGGVLALQSPAMGPLNIGSAGTVQLGWAEGLTGLYTALGSGGGTATIDTLAALDTRMSTFGIGQTASSDLAGAAFNFGSTGAGFPAPYNSGATNFVARWSGQFLAETSGTYTFFTANDDGANLWINGDLVVNNNFTQGIAERSGTVTLAAGWHDITVGYQQTTGGYGLFASYTAPGAAKLPLPNALLRSTPVLAALSGDAGATLALGEFDLVVNQGLNVNTVYSGSITATGDRLVTKTGSGSLTLAGPVPLSRFFVSTNTASNSPGGLVVSGVVSGTRGLTKTSNGSFLLTNPGNTFSGDIAVTAGWVAAANDGALGDPANRILVNGSSGFRGAGNFTTAREIVLAPGSTTLNLQAVQGTTMTLTGSLTGLSGTTQLLKADNGTVRLAAPGPLTWSGSINSLTSPTALTGGLLVSAGTLEIADAAALGSPSNIVTISNQTGAVLALSGGITLPNQVVLNLGAQSEAGLWAGDGIGTLVSTSGTNTVSGFLNMNNHGGVGAVAGATLNITGGFQLNTRVIAFNGPGSINVSGSAIPTSGNAGIYKLGSGTTTITTAFGTLPTWGVDSYGGGGRLVFSGSGAVAFNTADDLIRGGDTIRLDNAAVNVVNRLGGGSTVTVADGSLQFVVSPTAASSESFSTLQVQHGYTNIVVETTGQASTLNFLNLTSNVPNGGGTLLFRSAGTGANFGTAANTVAFGNAPALSPNLLGLGIMSRGLVVDGNGWNFATYSQGSIRAFTGYDTTNLNAVSAPTTAPTATVQVGSNVTLAGNRTINGLKLTGGGVALGGAGSTLTLTSGGILATGGTSTIASGGVVASAVEVGLNVADDSTLVVNAPLVTSVASHNITRGGGGTVVFGEKQYVSSGGGWYILTGGTTRLAAGDATLFPGQGTPGQTSNLSVSPGAVLDLAGSAQLVGLFQSSSNINYTDTAGTITSDTPALFATRSTNNDVWLGYRITGAVTNVQAGSGSRFFLSDNPYTGRTAILSNATVLRDAGRFSATSGIDINYGGGLYIRNNGQFAVADRVPDSAPITMRGGSIEFQGRPQTLSAETLGAVTLAAGVSWIQPLAGGTGVNAADLILSSIAPAPGSGAMLRVINANGQPGSNARLLSVVEPTLVNGIVPWAFRERDLAGYLPGLGFGALNAPGFPGYTGALSSGTSATANVSNGATSTTLTANTVVNSYFANYGNTSPTLNLGGFSFTVGSGAMMVATGNDTTTYTVSNGTLTAGAANVGGTLYFTHGNFSGSNRRAVVSANITNNGTGPVQLVITSAQQEAPNTTNTVTLSGTANSYSGGTVINGGQVRLEAATAGTVVIPAGGVTLNGGGLTMITNAGQIDPSNVITLNGGAALTLVGANTLPSLVFDNQGSNTTPTVTTGGTLTLSSGTAITASSMNPQQIATVNGTLDFGGGTRTITVNPVAYDGRTFAPYTATLNIGGVIQNAGAITVNGGGLLQVGGASTFTGGYSVAAGSGLYVNASSTVTSGTLVSGPLGTGTLALASGARLLSGGAVTVANPIAPAGAVTFEGITGLTLSGTISLPAVATFDVVAPQPTVALTGTLTGAGSALVKNGYGILSLTGSNTFDGGVTVNRGTLSVGNANALGTGALTMSGGALTASAASLTLPNAQVWNGGFGFVGTQSLALAGPVTLAQSSTIGVTGTLTVSGSVGDGGGNYGLTKAGNGILVLNGTNTYSGTTSVVAGVLTIGGTASLPGWDTAGRYSVTNGAAIAVPNSVLDADVATMLNTGNFTAGGAIGFDTSALNRTWSTALTGAVGLAKTGANGLILSASNSFTGPAIVYSGSLVLQNQFAVQNSILTVQSGASAVFDQSVTGRAFTTGGLAGAGTVSLVNNAATPGTITLTLGGANATTSFAGTLSGSGNLVKVGSGTQTLAGGSINYTGTTTINAGTLYLNDTTNFNSPLAVNAGATLVTGGATTDDLPVAATLTLDGGTYVHATTGNNDAWRVWNGLITIGAGGGTINLDNGRGQSNNNNNVYINGGLAGSGTLTVNATNMYGTNNGLVFRAGTFTFSGPTIVNSGIVWINQSAGTALASSDVTLNAAGNLRLDAQPSGGATNGTLKSLSGSGTVTLGSQTLTLGNNNGTGSFSGMIQGAGSLTKIGTGTQTLSGSTTFSGATTITGGSLVLANTFALQNSTLTPAPGIVFSQSVSPAAFTLGGLTGSGTLTLQDNAGSPAAVALTVGSNNTTSSFAGVLAGPGSLTKVGNGLLTLSGTNTYAGTTTLAGGTLRLSSTAAIPGGIGAAGGTGNLVLAGGVIELGADDFLRPLGTGAGAVQFTGSSGFSAFNANRTVNLGGAGAEVTWASGSFLPDGAALVLSSAAANSTVTFANPIALGSGTRTVQVDNGTAIYDAVLAGDLSGAAALFKTGAGKLVLSATNTFAGGLTVNAGIVSVSSTDALPGWNVPGRNAVASGGSLVVGNGISDADAGTILTSGSFVSGASFGFDTGAGDRTFAGVVSGVVGLVKTGSNTLSLSNANTFTGNTQILTGTLAITGTGSLGNGSYAGTIANAGTLIHSASTAQTLSGIISGAGGLQKSGLGTLTLSAANTLSGTAAVSLGTLALGNVNALQNARLDTGALGPQQVTFTVAGTNTYTLGALAGSDDFVMGVNSLSLGATNLSGTFSGVLSGSNFTKNGTGTQLLAGPTSNAISGVITLGGNGLLGFAKTGGAIAAPGNVNITPSATRAILYTLENNQFGPLSIVNFTNTTDGRWELKGTTQTIGGLVGTNVASFVQHSEFAPGTNVSGTSLLVINVASGTAYSYAGTLRNQGGTMSLTKLGSGTQTLQGTGITYSGTTSLLAGALALRDTTNNATQTFASPIVVSSTATLVSQRTVAGFANRGYTLGSNVTGSGTITIDNAANGAGNTAGGWTMFGNAGGTNVLNFDGTININSGVLTRDFTAADAIRGTAVVNVAANAVFAAGRGGNSTIGSLNGAGAVAAAWVTTSAGSITIGNGGLSGTFTGTLNGSGGASDGNLDAGVLNVIKIGTGTQIFAGSATSPYTGFTRVNGGVLEYDFANMATPTNLVGTSSALQLAGGTLRVKGKSSGATAQTVNGLTLQAGGGGLLVNPNGGTSTTVTLGALTTSSAGGSALVGVAPGAGAGTASITTTTALPATGVYSPRIVYTTGSTFEWATTTTTTPFVLSALASGSYVTLATTGTDTSQSLLTASTTFSGARTTNTIKVSDPAAAQSLTLAASATTTLTGGGLLVTGSNAFSIASGTLTAGNGSGAFDLIVHQYSSGTLTIGSTIVDNAANATAFTKAGPGAVLLTGSSTFTGAMAVNSGTVVVSGAGRLGTNGTYSGAITLATDGRLLFDTSSNQTLGGVISGFGSLVKSGSGTLTLTGANTLLAPMTVSTGTLVLNNSSAGGAGGVILGDASTGTNAVALMSNNGSDPTANITVSPLGTGSVTIGSSGGGAVNHIYAGTLTLNRPTTLQALDGDRTTFTGRITGTVGTLTFAGNRTTIDSTLNDFVGDVVVNAGVSLQLNAAGVIPDASAISMPGATAANLWLNIGNGNTETIGSLSGSAAAVVQVQPQVTGYMTLAVGANNASTTFAGTMQDGGTGRTFGLTKIGNGTLTLTGSSTFTGTTTISAGVLEIGGAGRLGTGGTYASAIVNNATLRVATSATQTLSNAISGSGQLVRASSGLLVLSGSNSYTGGTLLAGGTLELGSANALPASGALLFGGGVLRASSANTTDYSGRFSTAADQTFSLDTNGQAVTWATPLTVTNGGLRKFGSGTLALTASNAFVNGVSLAGGSLELSVAGAIGSSGTISFSGGTLRYSEADATDYSGRFSQAASQAVSIDTNGRDVSFATALASDGGSLAKSGSGTLVLPTSNSYTGATTITGGTLAISGSGVLGAGNYAANISNASTLLFDTTANQILGGVISGAGQLVKANTGTLTLAGLNTFSGELNIAAGTLEVATVNNAGANGPLGNSAGAVLLGSSGVVGTLSYTGATASTTKPFTAVTGGTAAFSVTEAATVLTLSGLFDGDGTKTFGGAGSYVITGGFSGTGTVFKTGSGALTLAGPGHTGGFDIQAGRLNVNTGNAFGGPQGGLTLAGGVSLDNTSGAAVSVGTAEAITLGSTLDFIGSNSLNMGTGQVTLGATTTIDVAANELEFAGDVVGTGFGIVKTGAGTLVLSGLTGVSSFTGDSTVSSGTLALRGASVLGGGSNTTVTVADGAFLDVGASASLGGVTVISRPAGVITATVVNANQTFDQSGTLGASNGNFNGVQTIETGVVVSTASDLLGTIPGAPTAGRIVMQDGSTLRATTGFVLNQNKGILLESGTVTFASDVGAGQNLSLPSLISGSGALVKTGAGGFRLYGVVSGTVISSENTYEGGTIVREGTLGITADRNLGAVSGRLLLDGGTIVAGQASTLVEVDSSRPFALANGKTSGIDANTTSGTFVYGGSITEDDPAGAPAALRIGTAGARAGTVILGGSNSYTGGTTLEAGTLRVGNAYALGSGAVNVQGATLDLNGTDLRIGTLSGSATAGISSGVAGAARLVSTATGDSTFAGTIADGSGTVGFEKAGVGTLTFTADQAYTGNTVISGGTLQVGTGGTTGSLGSTPTVAISSGAVLALARSDDYGGAFAGIVSGSGSVLQTGGTLVLTGSSTYTGPTTVTGGTLRIAGSGVLGGGAYAGAIDVTGGLEFASSADQTLSGVISGATGLVQSGSGRLTLAGSNSYTGATTIAGGALQITGAGSIRDSSAVSIAAGSRVVFDRTDGYGGAYGQSFSGAGGLDLLGGSLLLTGSNSFTGPTLIAGGTLALGSAAALDSSLISVAASAYFNVASLASGLELNPSQVLKGNGTVVGDVVVAAGAMVAPGGSTGLLNNDGTFTFGAGGFFEFELNDASNPSGAGSTVNGWDLLTTGSLTIAATSGNPYTFKMVSLDASQQPGVPIFDPNIDYAWLVVDAFDPIQAFDSSAFQFDVAAFQASVQSSQFSLQQGTTVSGGSADQLYIVYAAVPEPGTLALAGIGLAACYVAARRRARARSR